MDRLDEIRARERAATPGPWKRRESDCGYFFIHAPVLVVVATNLPSENNADFIARAREDIPWLLEQLAAKDQRIAELEREKDAAGFCLNVIYERVRPGGLKGGYPYGGSTCIGSDIYTLVEEWRSPQGGVEE